MKWISRLESRLGRFAIPNLTMVLIIGQVLAYIAYYIQGQQGDAVLGRIDLDRAKVLDGEVWRLVTFVFTPPASHPILAFFFWYLFYLMGTTLEHYWGTFRYNVYLFIGILAAIAASMLVPGGPGMLGRSGFLQTSVFLAFAYLYPDFIINLFLILPIRIKWLALVTWVILGITIITSNDWATPVLVLGSVLNFALFFGRDLVARIRQKQRRAAFEAKAKSTSRNGNFRHRCTVCGITNAEDPQMQFRYCSQCEGQLCYCQRHLAEHDHVRPADEAVVDVTADRS